MNTGPTGEEAINRLVMKHGTRGVIRLLGLLNDGVSTRAISAEFGLAGNYLANIIRAIFKQRYVVREELLDVLQHWVDVESQRTAGALVESNEDELPALRSAGFSSFQQPPRALLAVPKGTKRGEPKQIARRRIAARLRPKN